MTRGGAGSYRIVKGEPNRQYFIIEQIGEVKDPIERADIAPAHISDGEFERDVIFEIPGINITWFEAFSSECEENRRRAFLRRRRGESTGLTHRVAIT